MEFKDAVLTKIVRETTDSYSFIMDIPDGYEWKAGQHVLWKIKDYKVDEDDKDSRIFTIASAPEDGFLMFTTRIGEKHTSFKDILLNKIKPGDIIQVANPLGTFGFASDAEKSFIIAGGIGITPIRSLMKHELSVHRPGHKITLLYSDSR
ncbi:MAG: ferredoxin--NADP reductase, partial [Anaerovoracaceae bacterium]